MNLPSPSSHSRLAAGALAALVVVAAHSAPLGSQSPASGTAPAILVVAVDGKGRQVTDLQPADLSVTIDGRRRVVRSLQYVVPGGAGDSGRSVIVAVDEESILRGDESRVRAAVSQLSERLGPSDRLAVIALPVPHGPIVLTPDRQVVATATALVRGRASRAVLMAQADELGMRDPEIRASDEVEADRVPQGSAEARPARAPVTAAPRDATPPAEPSAADAAAPSDRGARPASPVEGLTRFLARLRGDQGRRTVLWVTGSYRAGAQGQDQGQAEAQRELADCVDAAAQAGVTIHVAHVSDAGGSRKRGEMDDLATGTGGLVLRTNGKEQDFERLFAALSGYYRMEIEPEGEEPRASLRTVRVSSSRRGLTVLAARRWSTQDGVRLASGTGTIPTPPAPAAATSPTPLTDAPPRPPAVASLPRSALGESPDPELEPALRRAVDYVAGYLHDFSNVVAEELYYQHLGFNAVGSSAVSRRLRSDLLLVSTPKSGGWTPFRDVFEVDGSPVRNREERLRTLFLEKPESAFDEGRRLTEESARYNIGRVQRTVNVPMLPLLFLTNEHLRNFRFRLRRSEPIDGLVVVRLDFSEEGRPTVVQQVRQGRTNGDSPSIGSLWVDPQTGRIVKTLLRVGDGSSRMESTVIYRPNQLLHLWTPFQMKETYTTRTEMIFGEATYSNFRRFQVTTEEKVTVPK